MGGFKGGFREELEVLRWGLVRGVSNWWDLVRG